MWDTKHMKNYTWGIVNFEGTVKINQLDDSNL